MFAQLPKKAYICISLNCKLHKELYKDGTFNSQQRDSIHTD